jgi:AraC-like DNA-binding protein
MPTNESAIGRSGDGRSPITRSAITRYGESPLGRWEMTPGVPAARLRPNVRDYCGWFEHWASPLSRRELPTEIIPLIINFGAPVRIFDANRSPGWTNFDSFTTGPFDTFVVVGSAGPSGGIQVNLTILGARLFLGQPLHALANHIVTLEDVFGRAGTRMVAELYDAPTWDARFAILDREIGARIDAARAPSPAVLWAWRRLMETRGRIPIATVVDEVGFSQKHLIAQFREHIGLAPKTFARVLRFARAVELIKRGDRRLVDLADGCGYYDQAHFTRDVREFAGVTPRELVNSLMPAQGGFSADR